MSLFARFPVMQTLTRRSLFLPAALLLLYSCGDDTPKDRSLNYPLETARLISQASSGVLPRDGVIEVRFTSPVIRDNLVDVNLKKEVFRFEPAIEGITRWKDRQTIAFTPAQPLPLRQKYAAVLAVGDLLPEHKEKLTDFPFAFEVAGREVVKIEHDFKLIKQDDPAKLVVTGALEFSEGIDAAAVRKAVVLRMNNAGLALNWSGENRQFRFESDPLTRANKRLDFKLSLEKEALEISESIGETFYLSPLKELTVYQISKEGSGDNTEIVLEFSDELDSGQDLAGLIRTTPASDIRIKVVGRKAYLSGKFDFGSEYKVLINKGVRSRFGTVLNKSDERLLKFEDLKPEIRFASDGVFLPSVNNRTVRFQSLNVRKVRLEIKRVFENNLQQFLQTEMLSSAQKRNYSFNYGSVERVGVVVHSDTLDLGGEKNIWKQHELDLKNLIQRDDQGLYLLSINFERNWMDYGDPEEMEERSQRYYYGDEYYSNPYSNGYFYSNGQIYKPLVLSDIGLLYKRGGNQHVVYATTIETAAPLAGVRVTLYSYQNQVIASGQTDSRGFIEFSDVKDEALFSIEGEHNGQRSVIKLNEMAWNLSTFDVGGESPAASGVRAYIYTERGVYRPGDEVNLSVIVRNEEGSFPDNHPVTMTIKNPRNQKVFEKTAGESEDGFYVFTFQGGLEDPTGNYQVSVKAGASVFQHTLKVETVVPFRLKVDLQATPERLTAPDKSLNLTLNSTYLFGAPAANLQAAVSVNLLPVEKSFKKYTGFVFGNRTMEFKQVRAMVFDGALDPAGKAELSWKLPNLRGVPSALRADIDARVFEKGGRPNIRPLAVAVDPYNFYVGIKPPETRYGYVKLGSQVDLPFILLDADGKEAPGRSLRYRIYRAEEYWWWEYDNYNEYLLRFKDGKIGQLVQEGTLVSQAVPGTLSFQPEEPGDYLVEVQDGDTGHAAGLIMDVSRWGRSASGGKDAGVLALSSDREKYNVGDMAVLRFPVPQEGSVLLSLEKGDRIIESRWLKKGDGEEMSVEIPLTEQMLPTVYASIAIVQPHKQTLNDRPLRMYGVVPLNVEQASTRQELTLKLADELRSNERFSVEVQTADGQPAQFTLAVVDEGLLDITRFETPKPWDYFFQKVRLAVQSFDMYSFIIGAHKGDVFRTFSIGGGLESEYRDSQLDSGKKKRFKPVSMFRGPLMTDSKGQAVVEFEMPNYVGSVRVMAISANGDRYGRAEKAVPVKTELMAVSSFPRVMGPEDRIQIPVTVFAMKESIKNVSVTVKTEGPLTVTGPAVQPLIFSAVGEQDVAFALQANAAVGQGKIIIEATSGTFRSVNEVDIQVRASSPRIYDSEEKPVNNGQSISMIVPDRGLPGSNSAALSVRLRPNMNFSQRILTLIRYPYGCIEQTISAVFPQLYLKSYIQTMTSEKKRLYTAQEVDQHINTAIKRLNRFQQTNGGLSYWPGSRSVSGWGTVYAMHFLVEARRLGYNVPDAVYDGGLRFLESEAMNIRDNIYTRIYRVYVLAAAGKPNIGAMNLLRENNLTDEYTRNSLKWMLAGAYRLAGVNATADALQKLSGTNISEYYELGNSYGSTQRDRAMILEQLVLAERWAEADELARDLSARLSTQQYWYSTQTSGFMLMAIGKYLQALEKKSGDQPRLAGTLVLPDGRRIPFDTQGDSFDYDLDGFFGQELKIELDTKTSTNRAFANLAWNGVPLKPDATDLAENISLEVEWLDEDGARIDPVSLTQGRTFWAHYSVKSKGFQGTIDEVALVQVLPAGWEIENTRLSGEDLPPWSAGMALNRQDYLDIRDDRVMWFFDLDRNKLDFLVKLSAVTVGSYQLPPVIAEAMYNNTFQARVAGKEVTVTEK